MLESRLAGGGPVGVGESVRGDGFYVAEEARAAFLFPVTRIVGGDGGAGVEQAEEGMLRGVDDDAGVAEPDDEVSGLRIEDALELAEAGVEVGGGRVGVGEAGALVESVDEVGAVGGEGSVVAGVEGGAENGESVIERDEAEIDLRVRGLASGESVRGRAAMRGRANLLRLQRADGGENEK